ncbi:MAG: sulfatase family protein, partial [Verrucomicrobiales bacterium]
NGTSPALIPPTRVTVARVLAEAGYETSVVGKWHLGLNWQMLEESRESEGEGRTGRGWEIDYTKRVEGGPLALGFTEDFLFPASLDMPPYVYLRNDVATSIPSVTKFFKVPKRPGAAAKDFEAENVLVDLARESRAFIKRSAESDKPFFLYLPLTSPHTPIVPSGRWQGKSELGEYGDFLMETDWVVGEILAELDAQGIQDETLVVFTSDNGCSPMADIPALAKKGHVVSGPLRGHKSDAFEGGHRVPFLVRWPETVEAGTTCGATVCTTDFFATAAQLVEAEVPADAGEDSFSLVPLFEGKDGYGRETTVHHSINGAFSVRQGSWKLILCPGSGGWSAPQRSKAAGLYPVQLYDLDADLGEKNNVAEANPERVEQLAGVLSQIIRRGRSNAGPVQDNDGWPGTTPTAVLELLPVLKP